MDRSSSVFLGGLAAIPYTKPGPMVPGVRLQVRVSSGSIPDPLGLTGFGIPLVLWVHWVARACFKSSKLHVSGPMAPRLSLVPLAPWAHNIFSSPRCPHAAKPLGSFGSQIPWDSRVSFGFSPPWVWGFLRRRKPFRVLPAPERAPTPNRTSPSVCIIA